MIVCYKNKIYYKLCNYFFCKYILNINALYILYTLQTYVHTYIYIYTYVHVHTYVQTYIHTIHTIHNIHIKYIYVGHLINLVNFHEMALQSIWWRDISKDSLFELLQVKFQPERTHSSRLIIIWSRLSQSLQNTHWRR